MSHNHSAGRRLFLRSAGVCAAVLRGRFPLSAFAQAQTEYSARAIDLVKEATVVDLLNQFRFADYAEKPPRSELWLNRPETFRASDAVTYQRSGIHAFALGHGPQSYEGGLRFFARWNGFLAEHPTLLLRIGSARDFSRARSESKIGILLSTQDARHFRKPDDVNEFFGLGQRMAQLTYNFNNGVGSGFLERRDGGLSVFGLSILQRMETVGMAVDLSHCGDQTTLDALDAATRPAIFTHATCRSVINGHMRAKSDEAIAKLAKTGGIIGINFVRFLVRDREPVNIGHVLDHFDHVRKLVGVQHLAVGSDLDILGRAQPTGGSTQPQNQANFDRYRFHVDSPEHLAVTGLDHPRRMFDLTEGLIARGYSDRDIRLILGGNAVRVLSEIWPAANGSA